MKYLITLRGEDDQIEVVLDLSADELRAIKRLEQAVFDKQMDDPEYAHSPSINVEMA